MNFNDVDFFPLGTRCSSAAILYDLGKRKCSYPFDWVDIELSAILNFITLQKDTIEEYLKEYFNSINVEFRSSIDNTWFPHDFKVDMDKQTAIPKVIAKYTRRFSRMFELFDSGKDIVFLTVIPYVDSKNHKSYEAIKERLNFIVKGNVHFITINHADYNFIDDKHTNFYIPLKDWDMFHEEIKKSILSIT